MSWNQSLISGPWEAPIYGAPVTVNGVATTPIIGYLPGVVFVLPSSAVTPALQAYASAVPAGVPVLSGMDCTALTFPDEATAQGPLAAYWAPDPQP